MSARVALALLAWCATACGDSGLAARGASAVRDPGIANARSNAFACTTCHAVRARDAGDAILPGAPLEGATARPVWWGGNVRALSEAVDVCFQRFMRGERLDPAGDTGQALLAYMAELSRDAEPVQRAAMAFTVPASVSDMAPGDPARGAEVYRRACASCHGAARSTSGQLGALTSRIPADTLTAHLAEYGPACTRVVFIEKIRHGSFFGLAGAMPPFSREVLSDAQLGDVLAHLGVPAGGECAP